MHNTFIMKYVCMSDIEKLSTPINCKMAQI